MLTVTGKTILASVIIEACQINQSFGTCYFYCKETDPGKNDFVSVLKGLLHQLLVRCRDMVPYCYEKKLSSGELNMASSNLAQQLLELFVQRIPKIYVIIDGIDECDITERRLITSFFTSLAETCDERDPGKLRVLFISQDYADIRRALATASVLSLVPSDNEEDLKAYARHWGQQIQLNHGLDDQGKEDIIDITLARARGEHQK